MLNKIMLIGRLGKEPETRYLPNGKPVTNASLATTRRFKVNGEQQEETDWFNLVFFGRLSEIASEFLKKGSLAYIDGRVRTRSWQDSAGATKYRQEVVVENLRLMPNAKKPESASGAEYSVPQSGRGEEVPF